MGPLTQPLSPTHLHYGNTRNTLDCDQSTYSSRIVFSHIPTEFCQTGNSAIRSADPEYPTIKTKHEVDRMTPCGERIYGHLNFFKWEVGRRSVVKLYTSYTDLIYSSSLR